VAADPAAAVTSADPRPAPGELSLVVPAGVPTPFQLAGMDLVAWQGGPGDALLAYRPSGEARWLTSPPPDARVVPASRLDLLAVPVPAPNPAARLGGTDAAVSVASLELGVARAGAVDPRELRRPLTPRASTRRRWTRPAVADVPAPVPLDGAATLDGRSGWFRSAPPPPSPTGG
jgi:hypothetical protein